MVELAHARSQAGRRWNDRSNSWYSLKVQLEFSLWRWHYFYRRYINKQILKQEGYHLSI